jgi:hypothetical protein
VLLAAVMVGLTGVGTVASAADLTEAEIIAQLRGDPNAVFARGGGESKGVLSGVRRPDTNGACLGSDGVGAGAGGSKNLVVVPIAAEGAPQINLALQFDLNSFVLAERDRRQLEVLARALNSSELQAVRFTVGGHTDASGDAVLNEKLSCARALSARSYLLDRGIGPDRLTAYGFGSKKPVGRDADNRRVEIRRADD